MKDTEINQDQLRRFNLILFGTPQSNKHVATVFSRKGRMALPIEWSDGSVRVANASYDASAHFALTHCVFRPLMLTIIGPFEAKLLLIMPLSCLTATHVPSLVYPSCFSDYDALGHYVVINSGLTSREGHDHNNSLQNPHLPDWAIVDITVPPSRLAPGKIAAANFFDESWQLRTQ
eukprot:SAG31_NODE_73_length_27793_cov_26.900520_5_plen_176_part_00